MLEVVASAPQFCIASFHWLLVASSNSRRTPLQRATVVENEVRRGCVVTSAFSVRTSAMWLKFEPKPEAYWPGQRECHTATCVGDKLFLFAGNTERERLNAVECLDCSKLIHKQAILKRALSIFVVATMRWEFCNTNGEPPARRSAHSAVAHGRYIYIFGGWNGLLELGDLTRFDTCKSACFARLLALIGCSYAYLGIVEDNRDSSSSSALSQCLHTTG